ncbi:hypothetical protein BpHYR1_030896 [Brachionus plicatilis]|uniref:Uncharacterized protein n=1 Tax=Brachionus plicatilis TaxID=10195 RepID=A0A3M7QB83_BRAPC|nr:hypothetical protein BpHYR1_030896 [Brachionus plicatilis]
MVSILHFGYFFDCHLFLFSKNTLPIYQLHKELHTKNTFQFFEITTFKPLLFYNFVRSSSQKM